MKTCAQARLVFHSVSLAKRTECYGIQYVVFVE